MSKLGNENDIHIKRILVCDQPHERWFEYIYNRYEIGSPHNSKHLFDIYTLTHIFWSLLLFMTIKRLDFFAGDGDAGNFSNTQIVLFLFLFTTYFEIHENQKEQIVKYRRIETNESGQTSYRGDSIINFIGDILGNILGLFVGVLIVNYFGYPHSIIVSLAVLTTLFGIITRAISISYWIEFKDFLI